MFEVGFTEILVISVLALVVLGPEKLPRVAAQVGRWVGRARTMARQFREQLEDEVQLAETNKTKAKEAQRAEQDVSAAESATAPATPGDDPAAAGSTQNMYSGVTGEDPHATDPAPGSVSTPDSAPATGDATTANAAAESAHSDHGGPAPEPEAAEYQPPVYAHAGATGTASAESSAAQPSPVESHSHDDDDPPRKPGDFIIHTHERGI
jgi:sec-independent protein translocase protein TatB